MGLRHEQRSWAANKIRQLAYVLKSLFDMKCHQITLLSHPVSSEDFFDVQHVYVVVYQIYRVLVVMMLSRVHRPLWGLRRDSVLCWGTSTLVVVLGLRCRLDVDGEFSLCAFQSASCRVVAKGAIFN